MQANGRFTIAIHICLYLRHKNKKLVSSQEIASSVNTNPVVIRRLIRHLKETGIIGSVAGAKGGFYLKLKPDKITLWQIYMSIKDSELFSTRKRNEECPVGYNLCDIIDDVYKEAEFSMENVLGKITIKNLHDRLNAIIT